MRALRLSLPLLLLFAAACKHDELPKFSTLPAFSLQDQNGAAVTRESLQGSVWVANFMFTSCPDVCPILTTKMASVRSRLVGERVPVRVVSFTVDPATDTPEVLKRYAKEHNADFPDWSFMTGSVDEIKTVVVSGFKQALGEKQEEQAGNGATILHGSHFVLVDRSGEIRGYYPSDNDGLLKLARDARILALAKDNG
jgi:protein SCO1